MIENLENEKINMMKTPNFFLIGAPKCGTTSMAAWLAEHPNIFIPSIKEPFFFSKDIKRQKVETMNEYIKLFEKADKNHSIIGEASTHYLFSQVAVPAIEKEFPQSKYLVMIRNPVDMAYSWHGHHVRSFEEDIDDFQIAWKASPSRRNGFQVPAACNDPIELDYQSWALLGEQLERLFNLVPRERVLVIVLDDVVLNPGKEYLKVLQFLNLIDDQREDFPIHNPAKEWKFPLIAKSLHLLGQSIVFLKRKMHIPSTTGLGIINRMKEINSLKKSRAPINNAFRNSMVNYFREDIHKLEKLLDRSFHDWLEEGDKYCDGKETQGSL